ncbi:MAG: hypothetical protein ACEQSX_20490, partial [Baekduiaceae bacterium]
SGTQAMQHIAEQMRHPQPELLMAFGVTLLKQLQEQDIILERSHEPKHPSRVYENTPQSIPWHVRRLGFVGRSTQPALDSGLGFL